MKHSTIRLQRLPVLAAAFALAAPLQVVQAHHGDAGAHHAGAGPVLAQASGHDAHQHGAQGHDATSGKGAAAPEATTDGEILKVDRAGGKVTVRHGNLPEFGMAPMTMMLAVREPALLDGVAAGDRVKLRIARAGKGFVIVGIERPN